MLYNRYTEICPAFHSPFTKYLAFPPKKIIIKSQVENCMKKIVLFIYYKTFLLGHGYVTKAGIVVQVANLNNACECDNLITIFQTGLSKSLGNILFSLPVIEWCLSYMVEQYFLKLHSWYMTVMVIFEQ